MEIWIQDQGFRIQGKAGRMISRLALDPQSQKPESLILDPKSMILNPES